MSIKSVISWGFLLIVLILAAGIASCSNPDERPLDGFFGSFANPLPTSPVGVVFSDPVFRQVDPDPLVVESYVAANLTPMTRAQLWGYITNATSRVCIVGTRITNADTVSRLVGVANRGVFVDIVVEQGYFNDSDSIQWIAMLIQTGRVTIKTDEDGIARQVHSRYVIIDSHIVLASSGDFLDSSFNSSINNTLIFDTPGTYVNGTGAAGVRTITDAFMFDFDQMFNMGRFGGDKERLINHTFNIGPEVEIYFGPNDNLLAEIADQVNNLSSSLTYAINQVDDSTMLTVMSMFADGGFYEASTNPDYTEVITTAIPFYWAGFNTLNHKFILIDLPGDVTVTINPTILDLLDPVVVTGSCNWTPSGLTLNDEQLIVVHDLTVGFEYAVEMSALSREAAGLGVLYGTIRTNKNVPIPDAEIGCVSNDIPGSPFFGDGGIHPEGVMDAQGNYALFIPAGFMREIEVRGLGDASGLYLLPDIIWGEDMPSEGYNMMPGASYEMNFYASPAPSQTGTGT